MLIFHHYDFSPFSEKVRIAFGLKGLVWRSVEIPPYLPKPDLLPLTGGYRLTPVLQIGAEIICDTRLIVRELDRRFPEKPLRDPKHAGLDDAIEVWAETDLFWPVVRYTSGLNAEHMEPALHADRAAMRSKGATPPPPAKLKAVAQRNAGLVRASVERVASMLASGSPFILGERAGLADVSVYHALWFLGALTIDCAPEVLAPYPQIRAWMDRMKAIGHGQVTPMTSSEALAVAKDATPPAPRASNPAPFDPPLGTRVAIRPEGYAVDDTVGELVRIDVDALEVRRHDDALGDLVVSFPRVGYVVRPSQG